MHTTVTILLRICTENIFYNHTPWFMEYSKSVMIPFFLNAKYKTRRVHLRLYMEIRVHTRCVWLQSSTWNGSPDIVCMETSRNSKHGWCKVGYFPICVYIIMSKVSDLLHWQREQIRVATSNNVHVMSLKEESVRRVNGSLNNPLHVPFSTSSAPKLPYL